MYVHKKILLIVNVSYKAFTFSKSFHCAMFNYRGMNENELYDCCIHLKARKKEGKENALEGISLFLDFTIARYNVILDDTYYVKETSEKIII